MDKFLITLFCVLSITTTIFAETITLKNGTIVEGKIIEETDEFIKIDAVTGVPLTIYKDEIEDVGSSQKIFFETIVKNMDKMLSDINDMTYKLELISFFEDKATGEQKQSTIEMLVWFKKPNLGKFAFSRNFSKETVLKIEDGHLYSYDFNAEENKLTKTKYSLESWKYDKANPAHVLNVLKWYEGDGMLDEITHIEDKNVYILNFSSENPYKGYIAYVNGNTWLPEKIISENESSKGEILFKDIAINSGLTDDIFAIPSNEQTTIEEEVVMAMAGEVNDIELIRCGVIKEETIKDKVYPGSIDQLLDAHAVNETDKITAKNGMVFGCSFIIRGEPKGAAGYIDIRLTHPPYVDKKAGEERSEEKFIGEYWIDKEDTVAWVMKDDAMIVPGEWTFRFLFGNNKSVEKTFYINQ